MDEAEWMWEALSRMEQDARSRGWTGMIDQINVTRHVLTAEASRLIAPERGDVVNVDFKHRGQIHFVAPSSN